MNQLNRMLPGRFPHRQRGAVLPVALFVLLIATLLAVSTMQTTTIDLNIAQNRQARIQTERAVERAIERVINEPDLFSEAYQLDGADQVMTMDGGWNVMVERPYCIASKPATGYSVNAPLIPEYNVWSFEVCATDPITGARVVMRQGVRMLMLNGRCLPNASTNPCV